MVDFRQVKAWCPLCKGYYTHQAHDWEQRHAELYHKSKAKLVPVEDSEFGVEPPVEAPLRNRKLEVVVAGTTTEATISFTPQPAESIEFKERRVGDVVAWLLQFSQDSIVQAFNEDVFGIAVVDKEGSEQGFMVTKRISK